MFLCGSGTKSFYTNVGRSRKKPKDGAWFNEARCAELAKRSNLTRHNVLSPDHIVKARTKRNLLIHFGTVPLLSRETELNEEKEENCIHYLDDMFRGLLTRQLRDSQRTMCSHHQYFLESRSLGIDSQQKKNDCERQLADILFVDLVSDDTDTHELAYHYIYIPTSVGGPHASLFKYFFKLLYENWNQSKFRGSNWGVMKSNIMVTTKHLHIWCLKFSVKYEYFIKVWICLVKYEIFVLYEKIHTLPKYSYFRIFILYRNIHT